MLFNDSFWTVIIQNQTKFREIAHHLTARDQLLEAGGCPLSVSSIQYLHGQVGNPENHITTCRKRVGASSPHSRDFDLPT